MSNSAEFQAGFPLKLKNHYWGLRHGTSKANQLDIIACDPLGSGLQYGLINQGQDEVRLSLEHALSKFPQLKHCIFYVSPLRRTIETANLGAGILLPKEINIAAELRERDFAQFDGKSAQNYFKVWALDKQNPHHTEFGTESPWQVRNRVTSLIEQIEIQHHNQQIILISHGDTLQLAQTAFQGIDPAKHLEPIAHLHPGELRQLNP